MEIQKKRFEISKEKRDILNSLLDIVDSVVYLNDDTIAITTNKNMVFYNEGHTVNVSKGLQLSIGKEIHLNPKINLRDYYENPSTLEQLVEDSKVNVEDKFKINLLKQS